MFCRKMLQIRLRNFFSMPVNIGYTVSCPAKIQCISVEKASVNTLIFKEGGNITSNGSRVLCHDVLKKGTGA